MDSPFTISSSQIQNMSAEQQVMLFNLLIRDEARRLGLAPEHVITTEAIDLRDEGIDALTEKNPTAGEHLAAGDVIWQFKKPSPAWAKLEKDLSESERVQEYFEQGAGYTYIEGRELAVPTKKQRLSKLQAILAKVGCRGPVAFLSAGEVAEWASTVPAAVFIMVSATREYFSAERVLLSSPHAGIEFQKDELRAATMAEIAARVLTGEPSSIAARVVGAAGVGKTRLVLELLREEAMADLALYASNPPSPALFAWVERQPLAEAIVVIDECEEAEIERYETLASLCEGRLRLISIGPGTPGLGGSRTFSLNPLDDDTMTRVVQSVASTLRPEQVRWVVEQTRGYVKLGRAVAIGVARGVVDLAELRSDEDVRGAIERLVVPDDLSRRAISAAALLTKVGFKDDLANQARVVAEFMALTPEEMHLGIGAAIEQGLVSVRGRYWYVSPEFLAVSLAAHTWTTQPHRIEELYERLPDVGSREALLQRLATLDVDGVRDVLSRLLGSDGTFRDLDSLDDRQAASIFLALSRAAPDAALERLDSIMASADSERLKRFSEGRRETIWALQHMAARRSTFRRAALHLLALAEAENETFGNNASGVWNGLFLTMLGATEADDSERIDLLREVMGSPSVAQRRLCIDAMETALETQEVGSPLDSGGLPPQRWRPRTWGELREYKGAVVDLLETALDDQDPSVRIRAAAVAVSRSRALARVGLGDEALRLLRHVLELGEFSDRKIWEAARATSEHEVGLTPEQIESFHALAQTIYGDSLADRVKRFAGKRSWVDWPGASGIKEYPEQIAERLADELISQPEILDQLLPWLSSDEAEGAWPLGQRLGVLDKHRELFDRIVVAAAEGSNALVLCAYLAGRALDGDADWVDALLDDWAISPTMSPRATEATLRLRGSDQAAQRLLRMIDEGRAEASVLSWTQYGRWLEAVQISLQLEIVRRLEGIGDRGMEAALGIIEDLLGREEELPQDALDTAWRFLGREERTDNTMAEYHWEQIARLLARKDPVDIARLVVIHLIHGSTYRDSRLSLIAEALEQSPEDVWDIVGESLLSSETPYRLIWQLEEAGIVDRVPTPVLTRWLTKTGADGARIIAQTVKPKPGQNDPILIQLLTQNPDVADQLAINYQSGSWTGPESVYLQTLIDDAGPWLESPSSELSSWAEGVVAGLRSRLEPARVRDEEWL